MYRVTIYRSSKQFDFPLPQIAEDYAVKQFSLSQEHIVTGMAEIQPRTVKFEIEQGDPERVKLAFQGWGYCTYEETSKTTKADRI